MRAVAAASDAPRHAAPTTETASTAARGRVTTTTQPGHALVCAGGEGISMMANVSPRTPRCPQSPTIPQPPQNPRLRRCRGRIRRRELCRSPARGRGPFRRRRGGRLGRSTTRARTAVARTGAWPWVGEESRGEGRQAGIWPAGQGDRVGGAARGRDRAGCESSREDGAGLRGD